MDCDTTIAGFSLSKENLHIILMEIMESNIEDNVEMHLISIDDIHEDFDYPGLRAVISAQLDKTKQTIKIDITTGDVITPAEIEYPFQLMFEDRKINVLACLLYTSGTADYRRCTRTGCLNGRKNFWISAQV